MKTSKTKNKMESVLVADIVSYSLLEERTKGEIGQILDQLFDFLSKEYQVYSRQYKGDYIECYIPNVADSLHVAMLMKTAIKSIQSDAKNEEAKWFDELGIRLAVGVGSLKKLDLEKGIIDGEAIYMAGRQINNESKSQNQRKIIKRTMFYLSEYQAESEQMSAFFALIDEMLNGASQKQSEILFLKLQQKSEKEIAQLFEVNQSVINRQSNSVGWNALNETLKYYKNYFSEYRK